jgi:hypothetical protein
MDDLVILKAAIWQDEHWVDRSAFLKVDRAEQGCGKVVLLSLDRNRAYPIRLSPAPSKTLPYTHRHFHPGLAAAHWHQGVAGLWPPSRVVFLLATSRTLFSLTSPLYLSARLLIYSAETVLC